MSKKNKLILIISEILFLIFILIILPSVLLKERPGISEISFQKFLPLGIKNIYIESFVTDQNNLNSISVLLKNPGLYSQDLVNLEILNTEKEVLESLTISGMGINDPGWVRFKFPPIKSQKGDIFYIKITSNSQKDNNLYISGNPDTKKINFKTTFTATNIKESFKINIDQQINNFKSRNIFQTGFYLFLIVLTNIFIFV